MATERRALLVLGMHRSGTSALTRVLNIYGAGLPATLLPANSGNETGFWESPEINRLNDTVLERSGVAWDSPEWFSLPPVPPAVTSNFARELAALIVAEFGEAPLIVVKDPRLCRLLPLWRQALALLAIQPYAVLMVRHPLESAASMLHRDQMPEGAGLLLWLQYLLAAEEASRQMPRAVLTFDEFLDDCAGTIGRVEAQLGITLPGRNAAADAEATQFLRPSLRHERVVDGDLVERGELVRWVRTVYAWLERARQARLPSDVAELDTVRAELAEAETLFGPSLRWLLSRERQQTDRFVIESRYWQDYSRGQESRAQTEESRAQTLESRLAAAEDDAGRWQSQAQEVAERLTVAASAAERSRVQTRELEARLAAAAATEAALHGDLRQLQERAAVAAASESALLGKMRQLEERLAATEASESVLRARVSRIEATLLWRVASRARRIQKRWTGGQ